MFPEEEKNRIRAEEIFRYEVRREIETRRLAAVARAGEPSGDDMRLACQSYVRGDVVIEVIHLLGKEGSQEPDS